MNATPQQITTALLSCNRLLLEALDEFMKEFMRPVTYIMLIVVEVIISSQKRTPIICQTKHISSHRFKIHLCGSGD